MSLAGGQSLVDFSDGGLNLLLADRMRGRGGLTIELGLGQPQRLQFPYLVRIDRRLGCAAALAFRLPFLDPFLNTRIRVNKSFTRITHTFKPTIIVCRAQTF